MVDTCAWVLLRPYCHKQVETGTGVYVRPAAGFHARGHSPESFCLDRNQFESQLVGGWPLVRLFIISFRALRDLDQPCGRF